jgi:hypothetical protein
MKQEWRKIPGVPIQYEVSNIGQIRVVPYVDRRGWRRSGKVLSPKDAQIFLTIDGKRKWFALAALVLRAFVGPPINGGYLARHLDDDRSNNNLKNLAWGTDQDNHNDAVKNGANFISYGHAEKPHSEETKRKMSLARRGKPTGHKMTEEHKKAMWRGYRKMFPEKKLSTQELCLCGCGEFALSGNRFIHGHCGRVTFKKIAKNRVGKSRQW